MSRRLLPISVWDIVVADSPESPTAQMVLNRWIVGEFSRLTAKDGVEFLKSLARNYGGTYLRCSRYEEEENVAVDAKQEIRRSAGSQQRH